MRYALPVFATLLVLVALALLFPYTGVYDVAADGGHGALERWYLSTTSARSIRARADDVVVPDGYATAERVARGAVAYAEMCQTCHGAPGHERSVIGEGMAPTPPHLSEEAEEWEPDEVYWILAHGIKMAGMPAFGPTHDEEELWDLVAFVEQLPEMTEARYTDLTASRSASATDASAADSSAAHSHADDGHDHVH